MTFKNIYYDSPIYLLYWILLKRKIELHDWRNIDYIKSGDYPEEHPVRKAIKMIDKYAKKKP